MTTISSQFKVITRSSIGQEIKIKDKIGYWSAAITKLEDHESRRIPLSGRIQSPELDEMEITAVLESLRRIPIEAEISFQTSCRYFYEGITRGIRENQDFSLWQDLDKAIENRDIYWKLLTGKKYLDIDEVTRTPSESILEQREKYEQNRSRSRNIQRSVSTPEQRDLWAERFQRGETIKTISESNGICASTVIRELRIRNLYALPIPKKNRYTQEDRDRWAEKYLNGIQLKEIAESETATRPCITTELKRRKIYRPNSPQKSHQEREEIGRNAYEIWRDEPLEWREILERFQGRVSHFQPLRKLAKAHAIKFSLPWPISDRHVKIVTSKKCKVLQCNRHAETKGFCATHYQRMRQGKNIEKPVQKRNSPYPEGLTCKIECCDRPAQVDFMCLAHYHRLQKASSRTRMDTPIRKTGIKQ